MQGCVWLPASTTLQSIFQHRTERKLALLALNRFKEVLSQGPENYLSLSSLCTAEEGQQRAGGLGGKSSQLRALNQSG